MWSIVGLEMNLCNVNRCKVEQESENIGLFH